MKLAIRPVKPTDARTILGFVERTDGTGGIEPIEFPMYPHSPRGEELRNTREAAGLTQREAARMAGISVAEWSGLERGSYEAEDWGAAFALVAPSAPER